MTADKLEQIEAAVDKKTLELREWEATLESAKARKVEVASQLGAHPDARRDYREAELDVIEAVNRLKTAQKELDELHAQKKNAEHVADKERLRVAIETAGRLAKSIEKDVLDFYRDHLSGDVTAFRIASRDALTFDDKVRLSQGLPSHVLGIGPAAKLPADLEEILNLLARYERVARGELTVRAA